MGSKIYSGHFQQNSQVGVTSKIFCLWGVVRTTYKVIQWQQYTNCSKGLLMQHIGQGRFRVLLKCCVFVVIFSVLQQKRHILKKSPNLHYSLKFLGAIKLDLYEHFTLLPSFIVLRLGSNPPMKLYFIPSMRSLTLNPMLVA